MNALIIWFTRNGIAANLLMFAILLWGVASLDKLIIEAHPAYQLDAVNVQVDYRGATPTEVEESIVVRIEEAVQDLIGIKSINSEAMEGRGTVSIEVMENHDPRELADDIKARIDTINTFPEDSEEPVVAVAERQFEVISVIVAADLPERELRTIGEWVRDDIASLPDVSQVVLTSVRPYEVAVEVSETDLLRYQLTLDDVAQAISRSSLNMPAGVVKTTGGEILLRTKGQAYTKQDFESIFLRPKEDGSRLTLGEIATIKDGFEEEPLKSFFDQKSSLKIEVYRVGEQSAIQVSQAVKNYLLKAQRRMPQGVELSYWRDRTKSIKIRLTTLLESALQSIILIFVVLTLFLRLSIAVWVAVGIPVSIVGAIAIMPYANLSINYTSVGAFIMVLGLVVDDAIVTGESIYTRLRKGLDSDSTVAAIKGTLDVAVPVTFGMLTTVIAFLGLLMNGGGPFSRIFNVVPIIVISVLLFSFVESKFILPSHLRHVRIKESKQGFLNRWQNKIADGLESAIGKYYSPLLSAAVQHRYLTLSIFLGVAIVLISLIFGGQIGFTFFPKIQVDRVRATLTMPVGAPFKTTQEHIENIAAAAKVLQDKYIDPATGKSIITHIYAIVGSTGGDDKPQSHIGRVSMQIVPLEIQSLRVGSSDLAKEWRRMIGSVPGAEKVSFLGHRRFGGLPLDVELRGQNFKELTELGERLKHYLASFPGVFDIADNYEEGKQELQLSIKPEAELLGITLNDLASQVQQAFLGREAQRIQRGRDDVRIIVRYPAVERQSISSLENMRIRAPNGIYVPFMDVAEVVVGRDAAIIHRTDRFRTLNVSADVNKKKVQLERVKGEIRVWLEDVLSDYPGVQYSFEGEAKQQSESFASVASGALLALVGMYAMLAIPFRSYWQPLIIMSAIPFGLLGAVLGHLLMDINLTINSLLGMIALIGIVVNDSLVLVEFINRCKLAGENKSAAVVLAGSVRFRPIILTSLTTFAGLLPLMFQENVQAQFLIPMAVSLGFGVLFATLITLFLIPINYMILEDISGFFGKFRQHKLA